MVGLVRIVGNINSEFVKHGILTLVILFIGTMVTRFLGRTSRYLHYRLWYDLVWMGVRPTSLIS